MLEVDLVRRIERNDSALLTIVVRQLGLAATSHADRVLDSAMDMSASGGRSDADRARRIEEKAYASRSMPVRS